MIQATGNNYQSEKASEAIINGGFFGKGIGEGTLKNRVPEAHTDYIVSVISEEFGVLFIMLLMIIFLFFVYQVFKKLYFENNNQIKTNSCGFNLNYIITSYLFI